MPFESPVNGGRYRELLLCLLCGKKSYRNKNGTAQIRHHTISSHGGVGHPLKLEDCKAEVKIRPKAINIVKSP
jgi:hypothetical protein